MQLPIRSFILLSVLFFGVGSSLTSLSGQRKPLEEGAPKRVLLLGDSISIGYTPFVRQLLQGEALVIRPVNKAGQPENCEGTTKAVGAVDRWLQIDGGNWDLIHFNFGLHDMKRVDPQTRSNSNDPTHPRQAELAAYERQLCEVVKKLKKSGARLIFATTTPVPAGGVKPHRDTGDPSRYNAVARKIMRENGVEINDLYQWALPRLREVQRPVNVHFTEEGSRLLAEVVARRIRQAFQKAP